MLKLRNLAPQRESCKGERDVPRLLRNFLVIVQKKHRCDHHLLTYTTKVNSVPTTETSHMPSGFLEAKWLRQLIKTNRPPPHYTEGEGEKNTSER